MSSLFHPLMVTGAWPRDQHGLAYAALVGDRGRAPTSLAVQRIKLTKAARFAIAVNAGPTVLIRSRIRTPMTASPA